MSATSPGQSKQNLLITLLLLLCLFVAAQAWYMFEMKKQLDVIQKQQLSVSLAAAKTTDNEKPLPSVSATKTQKNNKADSQPQLAIQENKPSQPEQTAPPIQRPPQKSKPQAINENNNAAFYPPANANSTLNTPAWNPYEQIERMQRDMDRMFDRRMSRFNRTPWYNHPEFQRHFSQSLSTPEIDVKENAHQYNVFVNLPGADEKDISVTLNGQRLTIKGKREHKKQSRDNAGNIILQERRSGLFQRSITLPHPVRQNQMKTRLDNGVLQITIPKVTPETSQDRWKQQDRQSRSGNTPCCVTA